MILEKLSLTRGALGLLTEKPLSTQLLLLGEDKFKTSGGNGESHKEKSKSSFKKVSSRVCVLSEKVLVAGIPPIFCPTR